MKISEGNRDKNTFTKECMVMALKRLLEKKSLDQITVTELAAEAGVSRTTFYRNYTSIADILLDYFRRYPFGSFSSKSYSYEDFSLEGRLYDSFSQLKKDRHIIDAIFQAGLGMQFYQSYEDLIKGLCRERAKEIGFRTKYELAAFSGMYFAICYDWIKGGMKEPVEEMVDISYRILHRFYVRDEKAVPERDDVYKPRYSE